MQLNLPSAAVDAARERFPFLPDSVEGAIPGGRRAALKALARVDPARYARTRNFLDGAVTQLSPYLRHGVLDLAEVRDHALAKVNRAEDAEKFISELGWRDYWQRLYFNLGEGIWDDREAIKTGFAASTYAAELPAELTQARTGLRCMDSFSEQLAGTGYLHNHSRMWLNAYVVHWLRVEWQAGARWFLEHLLDGDPASNNLSWQWGASTFSSKPYIFNRENLERFTNGIYCRECPLRFGGCPFQGTYEDLDQKLFPRLHDAYGGPQDHGGQAQRPGGQPRPPAPKLNPAARPAPGAKPLLWVHTDSLNPDAELFRQAPDAPAVFVWDEPWLREQHISSKRVVFLDQCLDEIADRPQGLERRQGDLAAELRTAATATGAGYLLAMRTPDPHLLRAAAELQAELPVVWLDPPAFTSSKRPFDLKRFSRFWSEAKYAAMQPTPLARR